MGSTWEEVRSDRLVWAAIVGGQKLWRHAPLQAKPLPFELVNSLLDCALANPLLDYDLLCFLAMLALGFSACARSGKLTLPDTIRFRDTEKLPDRDSVVISKSGFRRSGAKLFLLSTGSPLTRTWFVMRLHAEFGRAYSGHSLRSGGATHYALRGFLPAEIQRIGHWKSAAWEEYICISPELNMALLAHRNFGELNCICTACGENGHWSIDMKCPQHKRHSEWKSKSGSSAVNANAVTEMSTNHTIYSIGESSGAAPLRNTYVNKV
ncbi:BQ5605_C026g10212 [Microbotryum silenes-dioicae]|uniref:BQ5605_C026g10212 protein n=1 Tax=Microbotryum silenes-dioicae TaxID=796604 RepID=A0A2X0PN03_9BASI|nr:BQ5605_C026g10212 [Microbotryum silenes-dioicae]